MDSPIWDMILSILVIIHLASEYMHYFWEYISGRKSQDILSDIHNHRKMSKKTKKLDRLQSDMNKIKEHLGIE